MIQRSYTTRVLKEGNDTIILFPDELMTEMKLQEGDALVWDHFIHPGEEDEYYTLRIVRKEVIEALKKKEAP